MREKLSQSISPLVNYLIINVIAEISEIAYKDPVLQVRFKKKKIPRFCFQKGAQFCGIWPTFSRLGA